MARVSPENQPNKSRFVVVAASLAALLVAGSAVAGPRGFFSKDEAKAKRAIAHAVDDLMDDLDGTDAQRKAVLDVAHRLYADVGPLQAEKENARAELRAIFLSDRVDADAVHATVDERTAEMVKGAHRAADAAIELHAILTKEQRAALVEKIDERSRWHRRGWF